jgi:hypothetical protein
VCENAHFVSSVCTPLRVLFTVLANGYQGGTGGNLRRRSWHGQMSGWDVFDVVMLKSPFPHLITRVSCHHLPDAFARQIWECQLVVGAVIYSSSPSRVIAVTLTVTVVVATMSAYTTFNQAWSI